LKIAVFVSHTFNELQESTHITVNDKKTSGKGLGEAVFDCVGLFRKDDENYLEKLSLYLLSFSRGIMRRLKRLCL
jgi:hypothetical protein